LTFIIIGFVKANISREEMIVSKGLLIVGVVGALLAIILSAGKISW
jgi:hypothetical protein